jgi:hypothetical protein
MCRICGVILADQHQPWARLPSWPPMLLPGDLPTRDELCDECAQFAYGGGGPSAG